jgi:hypothetical protein
MSDKIVLIQLKKPILYFQNQKKSANFGQEAALKKFTFTWFAAIYFEIINFSVVIICPA